MFGIAKPDTILQPVEKDFEANKMWIKDRPDSAKWRLDCIHIDFVLQNDSLYSVT
jgi:hypothetical protein